MSQLDLVQIGSIHRVWSPMFTGFQTLGNTTNLQSYPSAQAIPVQSIGGAGKNPIGVVDNRKVRATTLLLAFAVTSTNASKVAFDITGFAKIVNTSFYLPTKFFLGEAQGSVYDLSVSQNQAGAFGCDQFSLKTFAYDGIAYIEPADGLSMAILRCDMRGSDFVGIRLAQGAATGAVLSQCFYAFN